MRTHTSLLLIRHAEVEEKYHRVFGGKIDMNLSARGHEQAAALAEWVKRQPLDAIYASPMKRVQQTLAPSLAHVPLQPVTLPDLREVDFGDWTGLGWEAVQEKFGVSAFQWLELLDRGGIPNAENSTTYRARVGPCLKTILQQQPLRRTAVFCHGGVIRMLLAILLDLPLPKMASFEIDYASVTRVELFPHKTEIQFLNFTPWREASL
ncbi:MAG: histidine phosphatase family protein [Verrucomicrobiota bacterium]